MKTCEVLCNIPLLHNFLSNWVVLSSCYIYNANSIPAFPKRLNYNAATVQELFRQSCYLHNLLPNWVVLSLCYTYTAISLPILSQRLSYNSAAIPTTSPRMMHSWYPSYNTYRTHIKLKSFQATLRAWSLRNLLDLHSALLLHIVWPCYNTI